MNLTGNPEFLPWIAGGATVIVLLIFLAAGISIRLIRNRQRQELHAICRDLSWPVIDSLPVNGPLSGQFLGRSLHIWESWHTATSNGTQQNSSSNSMLHIAVDLETPEEFRLDLRPDVPDELKNIPLVGQKLFESAQRIKDSLGLEDMELGNREFDHAFIISGRPRDAIQSVMDSQLQEELLQLRSVRRRQGGLMTTTSKPDLSRLTGFQLLGTPRRLEIIQNGTLDHHFVLPAARFLIRLADACEDVLHVGKDSSDV